MRGRGSGRTLGGTRIMAILVSAALHLAVAAFVIATIPLVSVTWTALSLGLRRFDAAFFAAAYAYFALTGPAGV